MCGVSAIIRKDLRSLSATDFKSFNNIIAHRGPDGERIKFFDTTPPEEGDENWTVAFGHRRLSIIDLTESGNQPMSYHQDNLWIVFNGEIYNYIELKAELLKAGFSFRGTSDTEVVLAAYQAWGESVFERLRGMWAIILFDREKNKIIVSRDRMGIKPLYYHVYEGKYISLASEIKQFLQLPGFKPEGNLSVIRQYLLSGFERNDVTFFKNVWPVLPGTYQVIDIGKLKIGKPVSFWSPEKIKSSIANANEASQIFKKELDYSVQIHLRSDVPVGCQLSGGLDSSSVFALMNKHYTGEAIHSFTVNFPGFEKDESPFVKRMLNGSAATPHFISPTADEFHNEVRKFVWHHDEPVGGFSHYAGFVLARLIASQKIKVVLNGQGGDEILGGYWQQYFSYLFQLTKSLQIPNLISHFVKAMSSSGNDELIKQIPSILGRYLARRNEIEFEFTPRMNKVDTLGYMKEYLSYSHQERRIFDIRNLILPRLLKWDDRNLMAFSVEGRYPFLDHKVIETALQFDYRTLFSGGWTKYPLRLAMQNQIPKEIYWRKSKWGFETPQQKWLSLNLRSMLAQWIKNEKPLSMIVTDNSVEEIANRFWRKNKLEDGQLLFRLYLMDQWLKLYGISIE